MAAYSVIGDMSGFTIRARSDVDTVTIRAAGIAGRVRAEFRGDGQLDLATPLSAEVEISARTLSSGNPLYDRELQRRMDGRRNPTVRAELLAVDPAGPDGYYRVTGSVSYRGWTRTYVAEMAVDRPGPDLIRAEGRHDVDMRDFGVEPPHFLILRVQPIMQVSLRVVAQRTG